MYSNPSDNVLEIEKGSDIFFFEKSESGIEIYAETLEVDGYEMKTIVSLDPEEVKGLFRFLKQNQFY